MTTHVVTTSTENATVITSKNFKNKITFKKI